MNRKYFFFVVAISPLVIQPLYAMSTPPPSQPVVSLWTLPFTEQPAHPGYVHKLTDSLQTVVANGTWSDLNHSLTERADIAQIINERDEEGNTPLHKAAQQNDFFKGSLLLQHGARLSIVMANNEGIFPEQYLYNNDPRTEGDMLRFMCCARAVFSYMCGLAIQNKPYAFEVLNVAPISEAPEILERSGILDRLEPGPVTNLIKADRILTPHIARQILAQLHIAEATDTAARGVKRSAANIAEDEGPDEYYDEKNKCYYIKRRLAFPDEDEEDEDEDEDDIDSSESIP